MLSCAIQYKNRQLLHFKVECAVPNYYTQTDKIIRCLTKTNLVSFYTQN